MAEVYRDQWGRSIAEALVHFEGFSIFEVLPIFSKEITSIPVMPQLYDIYAIHNETGERVWLGSRRLSHQCALAFLWYQRTSQRHVL